MLLAVSVTVAASWSLALWSPHYPRPQGFIWDHPTPVRWSAPVPADWPRFCNELWIYRGFGIDWTHALADRVDHPSLEDAKRSRSLDEVRHFFCQVALLSGWPWRAMRCSINARGGTHIPFNEFHENPRFDGRLAGLDGGIPISEAHWLPGAVVGRHLPLMPVWPGFALNTLLTWVMLLGGLEITRMIQRRRRRAADRCEQCGHDLASGPMPESARASGSLICPECGASTVPFRSRRGHGGHGDHDDHGDQTGLARSAVRESRSTARAQTDA